MCVKPDWITDDLIDYYKDHTISQTCGRFGIEHTKQVSEQLGLFASKKKEPVKITQKMLDLYRSRYSAKEVAEHFGVEYSERFRKALAYLGKDNTHPVKYHIDESVIKYYENHTIEQTARKFNLSKAEIKSLQYNHPKGRDHGGKRQGAGRPKQS